MMRILSSWGAGGCSEKWKRFVCIFWHICCLRLLRRQVFRFDERRWLMFSLVKRRPARSGRVAARRAADPFWNLREEMENLFDRFNEDWRFPDEWTETPDWNVEETDKEVTMRLELPGFDAKEIELRVKARQLEA